MMIERQMQAKATKLLEKYPLIAITGPRQSGKTTLAKLLQPNFRYVNLELEPRFCHVGFSRIFTKL